MTREAIIEFSQYGNALKVTAVCPATHIEISMVGDPAMPKEQLIKLAVQKLDYVISKQNK